MRTSGRNSADIFPRGYKALLACPTHQSIPTTKARPANPCLDALTYHTGTFLPAIKAARGNAIRAASNLPAQMHEARAIAEDESARFYLPFSYHLLIT